MPGRGDIGRAIRWTALVAVMGAALAAPVPFLEISDGVRASAEPLTDGAFALTYRQSVYDVPVREELRVTGDAISIERTLSADIRALEYLRWPGEAERSGDLLAWRAPPNRTDRLRILVSEKGEQAIETPARRVVLRETFGADASVTVRAARRPMLLWLWGLLPWA